MDYTELTIPCPSGDARDILISELGDIGFDSFLEEKSGLKAYISTNDFRKEAVEKLLHGRHIRHFSCAVIPHQNWNALWESNFEPVVIPGKLFVGATFHTPPDDAGVTVTLDPNMSFGTGHHPTTHLILQWLLDQDLKDKRVLDFGAGSGILCILASKLGASGVGVEIDPHATSAAQRNLALNDVHNFSLLCGGIDLAKGATFDVILANINRNVILEQLRDLEALLTAGGLLICSGFLKEDGASLEAGLERRNLSSREQAERDGWLMMVIEKHL